MIVLGIYGFGMNPAACLLREGTLVAFAEEERFTRLKGSPGSFPGRAIGYCLARAGHELSEVDAIAFGWDASKYPYRMFGALARQYVKHRRRAGRSRGSERGPSTLVTAVYNLIKYTPGHLREEIRLGLRASGIRGEIPPIEFVPHHLSHSYSTYFCSPFREAIVLTIDGSGEDVCTQVAVGRGETLRVVESIPIPHSLGWYYAAFTAYLGFTPNRHEGKLMGLAGLGHARGESNPWPERLSRVLRVDGGSYEVDPIYTRFGAHSHAERFTDALVDHITGLDPRLGPLAPGERSSANGRGDYRHLEPGYVDLAWGVQARLEEAIRAVATRAAEEHRIHNLCVAGGVGLNCKMNGSLLHEGPFEQVFVQPASNDAGTAIGAAMVVAEGGGDPVRNELAHAYYGPSWSNAEIRSLLERCKVAAEECPDVADRVAAELAAGKLVGWFQGSMEMGPRALGARSILASPALAEVGERLNREVKSRESWRPFCPSMLYDEAGDWLTGATHAPFMTIAFQARAERRECLGAVMHVDGTVRPQTVTREANPRYHHLLESFRDRTGLPFVLNTSFNVDGEPIVCTPSEALRCFYSSGLDVLALGDFVLVKT